MRSLRLILSCALSLLTISRGFGAEVPPAVVWRLAGVGLEGSKYCVAYIATGDTVVMYRGEGEKWVPERLKVPQGKLVPGGALILRKAKGKDETPHVGTIGTDGRAWEVWGEPSGVKIRQAVPYPARFPAGGDFAVVEADIGPLFFGVDKEGRLHEMDLAEKRDVIVEGRADVLLPGSPVRALSKDGNRIYVVDSRGNLVTYVRDPLTNWSAPRLIGTGFRAGGDLAIWRRPDGGRETWLASVNARGELKYAWQEGENWRMEIAPGWVLTPGMPLDVFHTPVNLRLFGINREGAFQEMHLLNTEWRERILGAGFARGELVHLPSESMTAFAIDAGADLLTATFDDDKWTTRLTPGDGKDEAGKIVSREWKLEEKKEHRDVRLINRSGEEVIIRVRDLRTPTAIKDHVQKAGGELVLKLDVGQSGTVTTKLSRTSGTEKDAKTSETTRVRPTGVENLYDVEILKKGPAIAYVDVRVQRTLLMKAGQAVEISVGSFSLTDDKNLPKGGGVEVFKSAKARHVVGGK